jgi:hypothetical protein
MNTDEIVRVLIVEDNFAMAITMLEYLDIVPQEFKKGRDEDGIIINKFFDSRKGLLLKNQDFKAKLEEFIKQYIKPEYKDEFIKLVQSLTTYKSSTSLYDMIDFK